MASVTLVPAGYDSTKSSFSSISSTYPITNAYDDSNSDTYTEINLKYGMSGSVVSKLALNFDLSKVPSGATINSVECKFKANMISGTSYTSLSGDAQLYSADAAMGSAVSLSKDTVNTYTFSNTGTWTYDQLQGLYLLATCTAGYSWGGSNNKLHFYGADLTIDYTGGSTGPTEQLLIKSSGVWMDVSKVYKKVNGIWVEQSDITNLFSTDTNYVKG